MQERLQLAGAIAEHRGKRLADLPDLTPLLKFTQGNPLTILVSVGEALRAGIDSKETLDAFIAALRGGEAQFEDEETEGRTKSLGASLSYGFASAFNEDERKILFRFDCVIFVTLFVLRIYSGRRRRADFAHKPAAWRMARQAKPLPRSRDLVLRVRRHKATQDALSLLQRLLRDSGPPRRFAPRDDAAAPTPL